MTAIPNAVAVLNLSNNMRCDIHWNSLTVTEWDARFNQIPKSNVLQSYDYACGICRLQGQKARWGLIMIDDQEAGLVQILEAGILWNAIHAVMLDRGPLWFDGFGGAAHVKAFFAEFNKQFPRRFGRKRRIIPETEDGPAARGIFEQLGLERQNTPGYQTIWFDVTQDSEALRAGMHKKWRNMLSKAERSHLTLDWDFEGQHFSWLMEMYKNDKKAKDYPGPDPYILQNVVTFSLPNANTIIGRVLLDGRAIASILIFCHGRAATYQVGWVSEEGRKTAANHLLLAAACEVLKDKGITDFDLGGVNDDSAERVKKFKTGLGGQNCMLVGHYL